MTDTVREAGESAELVAEISAWEDPPRAASPDSAPVLAVDGFEGPLDWLLEMAQARKIDLAHLSIGSLIAAFATAMEAALARRTDGRVTELGRWGGWLVMAATLAFLCSRLLLPGARPRPRRRRTKPRRCGVGSSAGRSYARLQIGSSAGRILDATCSAGAQGNATTVATGSTTSPSCCEPAWLRCVCRRSRRMSDPERAGRVLLSRPGPRSPPRCFWRVSVGFRAVAAQASARGGASGARRRDLWRTSQKWHPYHAVVNHTLTHRYHGGVERGQRLASYQLTIAGLCQGSGG